MTAMTGMTGQTMTTQGPTRSMRVSRVKPDIARETAHIIRSAQSGVARVVGLGPLILFSSSTGDAWLLDWQDKSALCLARAGVRQHFNITETEQQFAVEWTSAYEISGDLMTVQDRSGDAVSIHGYPTAAILQM
jgi:hypothetical protein